MMEKRYANPDDGSQRHAEGIAGIPETHILAVSRAKPWVHLPSTRSFLKWPTGMMYTLLGWGIPRNYLH